jgi:hypothetical protein
MVLVECRLIFMDIILDLGQSAELDSMFNEKLYNNRKV